MKRVLPILSLMLVLSACGGGDPGYSDDVPTQAPPFVSRVEPTSGPVGTTITIYGFGFSIAAPTNLVVLGGSGSAATSYQLLNNASSIEIESITAVVPNDAAVGSSEVMVVVYDNVSNADVTFTVTP